MRPQAWSLIAMLKAAAADGLDPKSYRPDRLERTITQARPGDDGSLARAEIALTQALAAFGSDLHRAAPGAQMAFTDPGLAQPPSTPQAVLASAPSLAQGLAGLRRMNPIYDGLRTALLDPRTPRAQLPLIRANLERARALPADLGKTYIFVNAAAQQLRLVQDGRVTTTMEVVVGKPSEPTPIMAGMIRYAVFRPYWIIPPDLIRDDVAPQVLAHGVGYLDERHYEAMSGWSDQAHALDPSTIDWSAVAAGAQALAMRQRPGPDNMMGQIKFMLPNRFGVYLHDTPLRGFFRDSRRTDSSGCVRLQDARRLAGLLLGQAAAPAEDPNGPPHQRVDLAQPVPVYIGYFTALPGPAGKLQISPDIYGRDAPLIASLAAKSTAKAA